MNQFFYDQEESPYYLIQTSAQQIIRDPKLFTITPAAKVEEKKKDEKKNEPIVIRASICCTSCVDLMAADFKKVTGIKTTEYDIFRQKVTVTGTATLADVLSAARRHFKDAELWD